MANKTTILIFVFTVIALLLVVNLYVLTSTSSYTPIPPKGRIVTDGTTVFPSPPPIVAKTETNISSFNNNNNNNSNKQQTPTMNREVAPLRIVFPAPVQRITQEQFDLEIGNFEPFNSVACDTKIDEICPLVIDHARVKYNASDVSPQFTALWDAQSFEQIPPMIRRWCAYVVGTMHHKECAVHVIYNPRSPLGNLVIINFVGVRDRLKTLKLGLYNENSFVKVDYKTVIFGEQIFPRHLSDKATYLVRFAQSAPLEQQKKIYSVIPRTYYVFTPCFKEDTSGKFIDQWDLWVRDIHDGNPPTEMLRHRPNPEVTFTNVLHWTNKQPPIEGNGLWVVKPTQSMIFTPMVASQVGQTEEILHTIHLHQGNAIHTISSEQQLYDAVIQDNIEFKQCVGRFRLVQKYVENPFLWDGKKADIRVFVLVVSQDPPIAYIYTGEYPTRVARDDFDQKSTDPRKHVTNLSKALDQENFDSMRYFRDFLTYIANTLGASEAEVNAMLLERLKNLVRITISLFPSSDHLQHATSLNGYDIIFDQDLNPWLMEINGKPDMRTNLSHMSEFKKPLVSSAIDLAVTISNTDQFPDTFSTFVKV